MLEERCTALAPLPIVYTTDPMFKACTGDAMVAAADARERVYEKALAKCVREAGSRRVVGCCFEKVTDYEAIEAREEQRCDRECAERVGQSDLHIRRDPGCRPTIVSPPRPQRSRAYTPDVQAVVRRCAVSIQEQSACNDLGSQVERDYCTAACPVENGAFEFDVRRCVAAARAGARISCSETEPPLRPACEARCQQEVHATGPTDPARP
jgi:hypothetical protein